MPVMTASQFSTFAEPNPEGFQLSTHLRGASEESQHDTAAPSTTYHTSTPTSTGAELSFGIEIEMIMAFHESLLKPHLSKGASILRAIPEQDEPKLRRHSGDERYRSWGVITNDPHEGTREPHCTLSTGHKYRAYKNEPLQVAQDLLQRSGINTTVYDGPFSKPTSYNTWQISEDASLSGCTSAKKVTSFAGTISNTFQHDFDTWGIELVSPPITFSGIDAAMQETSNLLSSLHTSESGVIADYQCGLHVHIGHPDNSPFDLCTLKYLAYLLIVYEDVLASMHPESRRAGATQSTSTRQCFCSPLRESFVAEEPVRVQRRDDVTANLPTAEYGWESDFPELGTIRSRIFGCTSAQQLVKLVQGTTRYRAVNFKGLVDDNRPNTIEFRQHEGAVEPHTIQQWVGFCGQLVATAQKLAHNSPDNMLGAARDWDDVAALSFTDLADLLQLDAHARSYWAARVEGYGLQSTVFYFEALPALDEVSEDEDAEN